MGRRQHFVPRFYLGAFASAERRIHVFNLQRNRLISGASLRDQCYAHRLYGADDVVENALARLEALSGPVFAAMRGGESLPGGGTLERELLLTFIGFQLARTTAAERTRLLRPSCWPRLLLLAIRLPISARHPPRQ